jgi:crotonobetainyl-CoA:carnitine CoA-transferase CaiB-like acyl-CoA transferase
MSNRPGPLGHLRVLEIGTEIGVPLAARWLGDLGADVIKVEGRSGDPLRQAGPFPDASADGPGDDQAGANGGLFDYLNSNKRSLVADLAAAGDLAVVRGLAAGADLILEDLGPGALESLDLSPAGLREANPLLSVIRLSNFGQTGPYASRPASGLTIQAAAGYVKQFGWPPSPPVQIGGRFDEYVAATYVATAAMTALAGRRRLGGMDADVSRMECAHSTLTFPTVTRTILNKLGRGTSMEPLLGIKRCADGWAGINVLTPKHWADVCTLFGMPEYIDQQEVLRQGGPDRQLFEDRAEQWTSERCVADVVTQFQELRIPAVPVHDGELILRSAQWQEREFFSRSASREGSFQHPSFPWRFGATPARTYLPAPRLGEHSAEIRRAGWLDGSREASTERLRGSSGRPTGTTRPFGGELPLTGVRVLDLGTFWAGAGCTGYLGALGADVIKVESVQRPDSWRYNMASPALGPQWWERGRYRAINLNKRGITLDLASDRGRGLFLELLKTADIVVENFAVRVMEKFGLGWDEVHAANPRAIMLRMPGFGLEGPWRDYVGFGPSFSYTSGHTALTGFPGGRPLNPGGHMDPLVAMAGSFAAIAALEDRRAGGTGQLIELSQIELGACLAPEPVIRYSMNGEIMDRTGNRSPVFAPQGVYQAADGRWVALTVRATGEWRQLTAALGDPDWARDPALDDLDNRIRSHDKLDEHLAAWAKGLPSPEIVARLLSAGIPAAVTAVTDDFLKDIQLRERGYFQTVGHAVVGEDTYPGWPMRFSPAPATPHRTPSPLLGEHNEEILGGELGVTEAELARLSADHVIGTEPLGIRR